MSQRNGRGPRLRKATGLPGWWGFEVRERCEGDPLDAQFGQPGLWQTSRVEPGLVTKRFLMPDALQPGAIVSEGTRAQDAGTPDKAFASWARASLRGALPKEWSGIDADELASAVDLDRLTVRAGALLAKGRLESDAKCLRLEFPELARVPSEQGAARHAWLRATCLDVQARFPLVRFGVRDHRVCAEVDLSGAPEFVAEALFEFSFEALVFAVRWALPTFVLLCDDTVASAVLDRAPGWHSRAAAEAKTVHPPEQAGE